MEEYLTGLKLKSSKGIILLFIIPLLLLAGGTVTAQSGTVEITMQPGDNIRAISGEYLGDPDMWEDILYANGLSSVSEIKAGTVLKIPVRDISTAHESINSASSAISKATDAGAKLFAREKINAAVDQYNSAVMQRKQGKFTAAASTAKQAESTAENAYESTLSNRNTTADAVLTDKKGTVENRKPVDQVWSGTVLQQKLNEGEKVRTLSDSYAEITFQDGNRLRLNDNAQAQIQTMRVDLLEKKRESSVNIIQGDAFAYLTGTSDKKKFKVDLPGMKSDIRSKNFWVARDKDVTSIANYEGEIELSGKDKNVVIKKNQGVRFSKDKLEDPTTLPAAPVVIAPEDNFESGLGGLKFQWSVVKGADSYWLEIASDRNFGTLAFVRKNLGDTEFEIPGMDDGYYYWRVAAVDARGIPGPKSTVSSFRIVADTEGPFLVIENPLNNTYVAGREVTVDGRTEKNSALYINGSRYDIDETGNFSASVGLVPGANEIRVESSDPAGNKTTAVRKVTYESAENLQVTFISSMPEKQKNHFVSNTRFVNLKGRTRPDVRLSLKSLNSGREFTGKASEQGEFNFNLDTEGAGSLYLLKVSSLSGITKEDTISIDYYNGVPKIELDRGLPKLTAENYVNLEGSVTNVKNLTVNGKPVAVTGGKFEDNFRLNEGENEILLSGKDDFGTEATLLRNIFLDTTPPVVKNVSLEETVYDNYKLVKISFEASDSSGIRKTAEVKYWDGSVILSREYDLGGTDGKYYITGSFPAVEGRRLVINSVVLTDYLGNFVETSVK